jgi:ketosteroid isomerase-like protein
VNVEALVAANAEFYARFEALHLDGMDELWDRSDDVWCVHPGTDLITGSGPVRRSWAAVFASTSYLQFIVTDVVARVVGDAGMVTCTENILTSAGAEGDLGAGKAIASNLFTWRDGRWRMVAHHASPVLRRTAV